MAPGDIVGDVPHFLCSASGSHAQSHIRAVHHIRFGLTTCVPPIRTVLSRLFHACKTAGIMADAGALRKGPCRNSGDIHEQAVVKTVGESGVASSFII